MRTPLQPIQQRGGRFAQGQTVAIGGAERGLGGEGLHLQALADEGAAGAGQLDSSRSLLKNPDCAKMAQLPI